MIILNIYLGEKKRQVEILSPSKINETNLIEYPLNLCISTNSSEISIFDDISKRYNQNINDIIIKEYYSSSYMKSKRLPSYCIYYCF